MTRGGLLVLVHAVFVSLAGSASTPSGIHYSSLRTTEPQSIHWIDVDPTQVQLVVAVARQQVLGKEKPSSMARRHGADAAVNGGFMYSPAFGPTTLNQGPELLVADRRIIKTTDGGSRIPANGFVLALDELLSSVEPGLEVRLDNRLTARKSGMEINSDGCSIVSAGPALMREGKVLDDYEAESSKQEQGAYDAYNLDGGGSSTMIVSGTIVNSPSDEEGERPSSDAIIFRAR